MQRNTCRGPFQKRLDLSIRQAIPQVRAQNLALQLDVFNFMNLLGKAFGEQWGQVALPNLSPTFEQQAVLTQTARTPGPLSQSYPVFTYAPAVRNSGPFVKSQTSPSNFYQMQLTLRWSF